MKKQILYALLVGLASIQTASAQELIEFPDSTVLPLERVIKISPSKLDDSGETVSYTVDVITAQGKDSTIYIDLPLRRSYEFNFWGGTGWVTNQLTGKTTQEQNQDFYGWVESVYIGLGDCEVNVGVLPSYNLSNSYRIHFDDAGYCISKSPNPTVSDNVIKGSDGEIDYYNNPYNNQYRLLRKTFYLKNSFSDNEMSYTLSCGINKNNIFYSRFNRYYNIIPFLNLYLENETTYYLRPYIVLNGITMYGGELSFTTNSASDTMTGKLSIMKYHNQYYYSHYLDKSTCLVIEEGKLQTLLGDKVKLTSGAWYDGVRDIVEEFLTADMLEQIRALSYSEEYSDGTLYVASDIPEDIVSSFQEHLDSLLAAEYSFNLTYYDIVTHEEELYGSNERVTKNVSGYDYFWNFDSIYGIPNNSCIYVRNAGTQNPSIGMRISQYLFPQTYDIYAVIVNPYVDTDPRANRFYTYIWEKDDKGLYPRAGVRMVKEDGYYIFETHDSTLCDTVYLGSYTFNGNAEPIIQFVSNISSAFRSDYTYNMGISQIKFVPTKKEDNE